jgi:phospholipid-binding lipoprotein MlaA
MVLGQTKRFLFILTVLVGGFFKDGYTTPVAEGTVIEDVERMSSASEEAKADDPLECFNRCIFAFNQVFDGLFLRPAACAFQDFFSEPMRDAVTNFFDNLGTPVTFANDVFQLEGKKAGESLLRFFVNSTLGVAGFFDVAEKELDLHPHKSDFGQTLGVYHILSGPYLVLPLLGPSNFRDALGRLADGFMDPYNIYTVVHHKDGAFFVRAGLEGIVRRSQVLKITDSIDKTADPYVQYRILYLQHRESVVQGDNLERESPVPSEFEKGKKP